LAINPPKLPRTNPAVKANPPPRVGLAHLTPRANQPDLASKQLEIVPSDRTPIARPLYLVHRGRSRLPPAASELYRMLRS
jgi:DNA-binding transcriptional LysR family regulator